MERQGPWAFISGEPRPAVRVSINTLWKLSWLLFLQDLYLFHWHLVPFCLASTSHSTHDVPVSEFSTFWILHAFWKSSTFRLSFNWCILNGYQTLLITYWPYRNTWHLHELCSKCLIKPCKIFSFLKDLTMSNREEINRTPSSMTCTVKCHLMQTVCCLPFYIFFQWKLWCCKAGIKKRHSAQYNTVSCSSSRFDLFAS